MKKILSVFLLVASSGCATTANIPLQKSAQAKIDGAAVVSTKRAAPDFLAHTYGKAVFGLVGVALMVAEGNALVKEHELKDPAPEISEALLGRLVLTRGIKALEASKASVSEDPKAVAMEHGSSEFVLDIQSKGWGFVFAPLDPFRYRVNYSARMRLIEVASKSVVAEINCASVQGEDSNLPTKDQLLENGASLLKTKLSLAASTCVEMFAREGLAL